MKRFFKYGVVPVVIFVALLVFTVVLIPILINVQRFVPEIERQVRVATGRSFSLGPDLGLTFFPWLSVSFSDLKLGNPAGFTGDDFIQIRSFEARIKVLPLLRKKIEVSRFVVGGLSVNLEKNSAGHGNWERDGKAEKTNDGHLQRPWALNFFSEDLAIALLAVTDGYVQWHDRTRNTEYRVEDIMLLINDFSPGSPFSLDCKASSNGKPLAVEGQIGPLLNKDKRMELPVDLTFSLVNKLWGQVHGKLTQLDQTPYCDLLFDLSPFSLREVYAAWELPFPLATKDMETLKMVDLEFAIQGDRNQLQIDKGIARIDDSHLKFSLLVKNLQQPEVHFTIDLDRIDVDRYLSWPDETPPASVAEPHLQSPAAAKAVGDYSLAGLLRVGELKIYGGTLAEVNLPVQGKAGVYTVAPATFAAYQGKVSTELTVDTQLSPSASQVVVKARDVALEPLLRDFGGGEYLRGTLTADAALHFAGDTMDTIRKSAGGEATLLVRDGALLGIDLIGATPPGNREKINNNDSPQQPPKTEFTEGKGLIAIDRGVLHFQDTTLVAPSHWLQVNGSADMVEEQLDVQIEGGYVETVVGKGGREKKVEHSSFYSLTGSFTEPELKNNKILANGKGSTAPLLFKQLVAQKLPAPVDAEGKKIVGRDLVDPAVVAERFGLHPESLSPSAVKTKLPVGAGKIKIGPLHQEPALY